MRSTRVLTAGLFLLAAACSSSPTTSNPVLDALVTADVATMTAHATVEDVDVMAAMDGDLGFLLAAPMPSGMFLTPPHVPNVTGCTLAGGVFTCPPVTRDGLTINRSVAFLPGAAGYDPLTTASIHVVASVAGTVSHGGWSATVSRNRDFTVSGLVGTETQRTVNGTGNETLSRSRLTSGGETRQYDLTGTHTAVNVVVPVRAEGVTPWPLSGTITRNYTVTLTLGSNAGRTMTRVVVITFNGTSTPTATVNGEPFTIDLANRTARRP